MPVTAMTSMLHTADVALPVTLVTIVELAAAINMELAMPYQLTEKQTQLMQAAFGDVQLLQDLRHMDGDLLNSQLRSLGKLNALQICAVRQKLCSMQQ